jgi:hypothetical protein
MATSTYFFSAGGPLVLACLLLPVLSFKRWTIPIRNLKTVEGFGPVVREQKKSPVMRMKRWNTRFSESSLKGGLLIDSGEFVNILYEPPKVIKRAAAG